MEPRIQYAKTSDGVRVAYTTIGRGPPLVVSGDIADAHVELIWREDISLAHLYRSLAERNTIVKFDPRGLGLSDRDYSHLALDDRLLDLEAVVQQLALNDFRLLGCAVGGPLAIQYAARHPERVSKLVLAGSPVRTAELLAHHRIANLSGLMRTDWEMYLENLAAVNVGYGSEEASRTAKFLAACVEPAGLLRLGAAWAQDDVTEALMRVQCPTLIIHLSGVHYLTIEMARELASGIPKSQLVVVNSAWAGNLEQVASAINDFVAIEDRLLDSPSDTAVILFADIADSTALTERLGDTAFRDKARGLDAAMRAAIRDNGGTAVEGKTLGDGVLAVFTSAKQAIACAQACHEAAGAAGLALHAGIHAGDVIREADNVYGGAVNIAARVAAASAAGETLVSGTVRDLARTSAGVSFEDRGEQALKGIEEPQRLFAVVGSGQAEA